MKNEKPKTRDLKELGLLVSDQSSAMLAYWDKDLICRFANNAYMDWFGKSREEMIDKIHIKDLLNHLYEINLPYISGVLAGEKQLFEREIPIPGKEGIRNSLASYVPDFKDGLVVGFFVHVADVTYIKNLEKELVDAKREILKNIIITEEKERRDVVELLRENINQKLAACKMLIGLKQNDDTEEQLNAYLTDVISEISLLCNELSPTEIEDFGLINSINHKVTSDLELNASVFLYEKNGNDIEELSLKDKLAIYRIIQNLIKMINFNDENKSIVIELKYNKPRVNIILRTNNNILLDKNSKEYQEVLCRTEYYAGNIHEKKYENENMVNVEFQITNN